MAVGGGLGGILIVFLYLVLGGDSGDLALDGGSPASTPPPAGEDLALDFGSVILASTEEVWSEAFATAGLRYDPPSMVIYSGRMSSACGLGSSAMGPFYCPSDRTIYLDLTFFDDLARLGGPGDFAAAYVIGHDRLQRRAGREVVPETFTHPAVRDGALRAEPHPGIGGYRAVALPPVFGGRRAALRAPPPAIGEHTDAILGELGHSEEELRRLRKAGIVA